METEYQFVRQRCLRIVAVSCLLRIRVGLSRTVTRFTRQGSFAVGIDVSVAGLSKLCRFRFVTPAAGRVRNGVRCRRSRIRGFLGAAKVDAPEKKS